MKIMANLLRRGKDAADVMQLANSPGSGSRSEQS
jgi:hypothetical protein